MAIGPAPVSLAAGGGTACSRAGAPRGLDHEPEERTGRGPGGVRFGRCRRPAGRSPGLCTPCRRGHWTGRPRIGTAVAVVVFVLLATNGRPWDVFERGPFTSDFYDVQARAMSRGHLDVPAEVVASRGSSSTVRRTSTTGSCRPSSGCRWRRHRGGGRAPGRAQSGRRARRRLPRRCPLVAAREGGVRHRGPGAVVAVDNWWLRPGGRAVQPAAVAVVASARVPRGRALGCGAGAARVRSGRRLVVEARGGSPGRRGAAARRCPPGVVGDGTSPGAGRAGGGAGRAAGTGGRPGGGAAAAVPVLLYASVNLVRFDSAFSVPFDKQVLNEFSAERRAALADNGGTLFGSKFVPTAACSTCGLTRSNHGRCCHGSRGAGGLMWSVTSRSTLWTGRRRCR